jgi:hypothetical protein
MINPMIFARHAEPIVFAEALRVAADVVERGEHHFVEFLGTVRPVKNVEGTEIKIFFRMSNQALGTTYYVASDGELL